jgi:hypothetical protein
MITCDASHGQGCRHRGQAGEAHRRLHNLAHTHTLVGLKPVNGRHEPGALQVSKGKGQCMGWGVGGGREKGEKREGGGGGVP